MKKEQLTKLYDLMKGLLLTYDDGIYDDEELQNVRSELDRIISDRINNKTSKDDLRWCNEIWNKYKCDKLEDEINKMVYSGDGFHHLNELRRTHIVLYEPTSLGYEIDDFIIKRRSYLNNDGKEDGLTTFWYENGKKSSEITYKNGKLEGLMTRWYEYGQKQFERTYKDGKEDGLFISWYENGQKEFEGINAGGFQDGLWKSWHTNGSKMAEENYKDGIRIGTHTFWYENRQKKGEYYYKDGRVFSSRCWDRNGNKTPCNFHPLKRLFK